MESIVEKLQLKDIDKSTWKKYRFDQIAKNISERVEPSTTDLEIYVGLEHIDSDSIHIKRYGKREDVNGTKLRCYPGDVIFGRRRAYQRKAAIVEFDGFCSAHSLVLRANPKVIHPKLFPFFLHSDTFMHRAVDISVGSLSPTINWGDLKKQEFIIPPLEQQEQLGELLWAGDEIIDKEIKFESQLLNYARAYFDNLLFTRNESVVQKLGSRNSNWPVEELGDFINVLQYGISESLDEKDGEIPILRMNNLNDGKLYLKDLKFYTPSKGELDNFILEKGDVLFNRTNSFELVGKVSLFDAEGIFSFASYLIRIKTKRELLDPRFLNFYLNSPTGVSIIRKYRTPGVSQSNINAQNIKKFLIPIPPIDIQEETMNRIEIIQANIKEVNDNVNYSKSLQKSIINQIF